MGPLSKIIGMECAGLSWKCIGLENGEWLFDGSVRRGCQADYKGAQGSVFDLSGPRKAPSAKAF